MDKNRKLLDLINIEILDKLNEILYGSTEEFNKLFERVNSKINENQSERVSALKTKNISESSVKRLLDKLYSLKYNYNGIMLEFSKILNDYDDITIEELSKKLVIESDKPKFISELFSVLFDVDCGKTIDESKEEKFVNKVHWKNIDEDLVHEAMQEELKEHRNFDYYVDLFEGSDMTNQEIGDVIFVNTMINDELNEGEKYIGYCLACRFGTQFDITKWYK